jgi:hypothetical protein
VIKKIILTVAAAFALTTGAQAQDSTHKLSIYRVAIQDAVNLEQNAKAGALTEAEAVRFLDQSQVQTALEQEYPLSADRAAYRYGFLMWIRHEWAKHQ